MKDNFQYTFTKFLSLLNIKVTSKSITSYLESHPEEGSMLAYSDALSYFNIDNAGIKVKPEDLSSIPTPFITYFHKNGGTFVVIKSITNGLIEWLNIQTGWEKSQQKDFLKDWSGIVLLAERNENSGENNYFKNRKLQVLQTLRIPSAISLLITLLALFIIPESFTNRLEINILLLLKAAGMILSSLLFLKSVSINNPFLNRLCNTGPKVNCQSILDSPSANITSWLSWSDMGFIYFFGSFFFLSLSTGSLTTLSNYFLFQFIVSTSSLFFCVYSIYYQANVANSWCTLCLGIVSILVLEPIVLLFAPNQLHFQLDFISLKNLFISFGIPMIFLLLFKKPLSTSFESRALKKELAKIKSNPKIFNALLANQKLMPELPKNIPQIIIGKSTALHTLTIISNPLCTPCARMHQRIDKLIYENDNIKCRIIFVSNTSEKDEGGQFVRKLFSLPEPLHRRAIEEWFARNDKNYEAWNLNYKSEIMDKNTITYQGLSNAWANLAEIKVTPSIFFNGQLLPSSFSIDDLAKAIVYLQAKV